MFCVQCGNVDGAIAAFCPRCGGALRRDSRVGAVTVVDAAEAAREQEALYQAVVGPKNQDYYLRRFARFDDAGKLGASWHWPAFFVPLFWLLYRKMWGYAFLYFISPYLVLIALVMVAVVVGKSAGVVFGIAGIVYLLALFLAPPIYANALYYRHCKKKIAKACASSLDLQRQIGELTAKGGVGNGALIVFIVLFSIIPVLAAIAIPAFQEHTARASLVEAVALGADAAKSVSDYYERHRRTPVSLEESGFAAKLPPSVKKIHYDSEDATLTITMAVAPLRGKQLLMESSVNEGDSKLTWICLSRDIEDRYLPRKCRRQK